MSDITPKLDRIRTLLKRHNAEAALISFLPDIRWASGFSGSNALLLVGMSSATLVTDGRYKGQASQEVSSSITIEIAAGRLIDHLADDDFLFGRTLGEHKLTDEPPICFQSDYLSVEQHQHLEEKAPKIKWLPVAGLLTRLTAPKSNREVAAITEALRVTEAVYEELLTIIEPGMTERDVAAEIVYRHMRRGADSMSFEPIVAAGENAALPHGRPSNTKIRKGDLLLIDMGCFLDGYASDLTRMVAVGKPDPRAEAAYAIVRDALEAAHESAQAGVTTNALDRSARQVIEEAGYGEYFSHGLGHGVGLQIHEWPRVSHSTDDEIPAGVVITLEPGIYIPGDIGIRIEDMVQITDDGCRRLTTLSSELAQI